MINTLLILVIVLTQIAIWSYTAVAGREIELLGQPQSKIFIHPFFLNVISFVSLYFLIDMNFFLLFAIYFLSTSIVVKFLIKLFYIVIFDGQISHNDYIIITISNVCISLSVVFFIIALILKF